MTTLALDEIAPTFRPTTEYERARIEANRRMAELEIVRIDYRGKPDGLQRFLRHIEREYTT